MCLPFIASFFYFVVFPGTTFGNSFYTAIKIFLLVWPLVAVGWILREPLINRSRNVRNRPGFIWGGLFGLATVGALFGLIELTPLGAIVTENGGRIAQRVRDLGVAEHYLWFALFVSFLHAALEEFYWRWFVYGQWRKLVSGGWAHLLAAIGFTAHHVVILSQFFPLGWAFALGACVGVGGAVWSLLYARTGSLWGAWFSHMIIDLGLMYVGWVALQG